LRKILALEGWSSAKIRLALKNPEEYLSPREIKEFKEADAADLVSIVLILLYFR
jgi:hypothetical protein